LASVQAHWDLRKLQTSLDRNPSPAPVYLIFGEEGFLVEEALKSLRAAVVIEGFEDFNYDNFSFPETSATRVREAVEQLPMMAERRLVICRNLDALKESQWDELLPLLEVPVQSTTLILVSEKIDKRKKSFKSIAKTGVIVELKRPFENQIPVWIDYIGYLNKVSIQPEAVSGLQQLVGTNLSEINNEVKKICLYIGDRKVIDLQDVMTVVSKARIENVFSLTDAIARRDRSKALTCLANLLEHGQNEIGILALIFRQIRIFNLLREGQRQGLTGGRLLAKVGVPEYFLKRYQSQSELWDRPKLDQTLQALHETDKALKSSPVASHIWLENFILKTC
jgi:DNA polymerase III subunit delta